MIIAGIIIIILGIAVNRFKWYNLIVGYNTLLKEEKSKINKKKLGANFELIMLLLGGCIISVNYVFEYFDLVHYEGMVLYSLFVVIVIANSFYWSKVGGIDFGKKIYTGVLVVVLIFILTIFSFSSPKCKFAENNIECEGLYGFNISCDNIVSIELTTDLPTVKNRLNGYNFLGIHKGYFKTKEYGECKFQIDTEIEEYIFIRTKSGKVFFLNTDDKVHTESLYKEIKSTIN